MDDAFYVIFDDQPTRPAGPFSLDTLREMAAAERISPETLVARAGEAEWGAFRHRPEIRGIDFFPRHSALKLGGRDFEKVNADDDAAGAASINAWLAANRQVDHDAGLDDFSAEDFEKFARRPAISQRMRDYLLAVGSVLGLCGVLAIVLPLTAGLAAALGGSAAGISIALTWVFFGIMEPY